MTCLVVWELNARRAPGPTVPEPIGPTSRRSQVGEAEDVERTDGGWQAPPAVGAPQAGRFLFPSPMMRAGRLGPVGASPPILGLQPACLDRVVQNFAIAISALRH
jgi:hypothetical protein